MRVGFYTHGIESHTHGTFTDPEKVQASTGLELHVEHALEVHAVQVTAFETSILTGAAKLEANVRTDHQVALALVVRTMSDLNCNTPIHESRKA